MVFKVPVKIVDRRINEWLTSVEQQIRVTLAASLAKSLEEGKVFNVEKINATEYLKWLDKFQVRKNACGTHVTFGGPNLTKLAKGQPFRILLYTCRYIHMYKLAYMMFTLLYIMYIYIRIYVCRCKSSH